VEKHLVAVRLQIPFAILLFAALSLGAPISPVPRSVAAPALDGWNLVWDDEFDQPNGSGVDPTRWKPIVEGNGSGNHELEYYTDRLENAYVEDGMLVIVGRRETYTGSDGTRDYTSARLVSEALAQRYGRFEARMKLPAGIGVWAAFWMMGTNIGEVGWPACGEIDVMEGVGQEPSTVHGSIHGPGYVGTSGLGSSYSLPLGQRFADDFHVFAVEWDPASVRFFVDDSLFETRTRADLPPGGIWAFDHPFYLLVNLAIGGDWPGPPNGSTEFPLRMLVDYVRVYERPGSTVGTCAPAEGRRGSAIDVKITGAQFAEGANVVFGEKVVVVSTTVVSSREIDCRIKIKKKSARGVHDVVVTNPDGGTGIGRGIFRVH
jgi:beta-glucanase (GH16 family)